LNRLFIVAQAELARRLSRDLEADGFSCYVAQTGEDVSHIGAEVVLVHVDESQSYQKTEDLCRNIKLERHLPLIALINKATLLARAGELKALPCDDFIFEPYDRQEILLRIRKIIGDESHVADQKLVCGDLVINLTQAEVFLNGRVVELTFRASFSGQPSGQDVLARRAAQPRMGLRLFRR
jgi:DNA-binding response OmpR family regulator